MPPNSVLATSATRAPRSAAHRAAIKPAGPAPITTTSVISYSPTASGSAGRFRDPGRFAGLGSQFDVAEQNLVPLRLQLRDGARSDLGMDAVDELLLHFRRQHRRAEGLPPSCHRPGELL